MLLVQVHAKDTDSVKWKINIAFALRGILVRLTPKQKEGLTETEIFNKIEADFSNFFKILVDDFADILGDVDAAVKKILEDRAKANLVVSGGSLEKVTTGENSEKQ